MMSCCPEGALGQLGDTGYQPKGRVERVEDLDIYVAGSPGQKCILWNYDIWGFHSGRTKQLCDVFSEAGYLVLLPDFFRGAWKDPRDPTMPDLPQFIKDQTSWNKLEKDLEGKVLPLARGMGAQRFGSVGTCWGSYLVMKVSARKEFKAGASWHPSHTRICPVLGESESALLQDVRCPQLLLPAGNDALETKPGGLAHQILGDQAEFLEFPEMLHGWTSRGDMQVDSVCRDVKMALQRTLQFFEKHL